MPDVRTYIGPYPPTKPKDTRTFIWSRCDSCGWLAVHLEESQSMQHTIVVSEHRCEESVQLDLFGAA